MSEAVRDHEVVVGGEPREVAMRHVGVGEMEGRDAVQLAQQRTEQREPRTVEGRYPHRSLIALEEGADRLTRGGERLIDACSGGGERLSRRGEDQGPPAAYGQRHGNPGLEMRELLRHRRCRDVLRRGDGGHAAAVAELAQQAEVSGIHKSELTGL